MYRPVYRVISHIAGQLDISLDTLYRDTQAMDTRMGIHSFSLIQQLILADGKDGWRVARHA